MQALAACDITCTVKIARYGHLCYVPVTTLRVMFNKLLLKIFVKANQANHTSSTLSFSYILFMIFYGINAHYLR